VKVLAVLLGLALLGAAVYFALPAGDGVSAPPTLEESDTSQVYGVFEGRVPCYDCERIKVRLTLLRNPATHAPTEYMLERIYVGKGNDRTTTRGRWSVLDVPMPDRYGVAYRLDEESPPDFSLYLPVGDLLLFLNPDMRPRVGDASGSFTLSKTR
jgi:hypothetical protein